MDPEEQETPQEPAQRDTDGLGAPDATRYTPETREALRDRLKREADRLPRGVWGIVADTVIVNKISEVLRPACPTQGQTIYERDSGQLLEWDDLVDGWVVIDDAPLENP